MKKVLSLILAMLMLTAMLASCQPANEDLGSGSTGSTDYAKVVWFWNEGNRQLPLDGYVIRKVKEDINIDYVHISPKGTDYQERLMLLISGGETPDIITAAGNNLTQKLKTENLIQPITEYLNETYLPNVIRTSANWDEAIELLKHNDGENYGVPNCSTNLIGETPFIRMDWLEKVNKEVPTTMDELLDVLLTFAATEDINGDGTTTYATISNETYGLGQLFWAFGCSIGTWYKGEDGLPEMGMFTDRMKDAVRFIKTLMDNNAINKDLMTTKFEGVQEKVKAGRVGYFFGYTGGNDETAMKQIYPDARWERMVPVQGVYDKGYLPVGGVVRDEYLISAEVTNFEPIWRLMNYMADDKSTAETGMTYEGSYWEQKFGERGVNWDVIDGVLVTSNRDGIDKSLTQHIDDQNKVDTWAVVCCRFRSKFDTIWMGTEERGIADMMFWTNEVPHSTTMDYSHPAAPVRYRGQIEDADVNAFTSEWSLNKFQEQFFYNAINGKGEIDALFDQFLANANKAGYQNIRAIVGAHIEANPY